MSTRSLSATAEQSKSQFGPILTSALIGAVLIFAAGFASPDALHAATHDTRHATGFPCH